MMSQVPSAIAELPWLQRKLAKLAVDCSALAAWTVLDQEVSGEVSTYHSAGAGQGFSY